MECLTYDSPFQQASFSGTRTALIPYCFIARIDAALLGPSKIPRFCAHMNSVPERSTPWSTTRWPEALTSLLPDTCSCGAELGDCSCGAALGDASAAAEAAESAEVAVELLVAEVRARDSSVAAKTATAKPATFTLRVARSHGRLVTGCSPPVATGPALCSPRIWRTIVDRNFNFDPPDYV